MNSATRPAAGQSATVHPLAPLMAWRQWIIVLLVPRAGGIKHDKLPIDPRTGQVTIKGNDGAHDPAIWLDYATARDAAERLGSANHGIGFVLTAADPWVCFDIDDARQADGAWSSLALELCAMLPGAVVELSHSGTGLHLWARCNGVPPHQKKRTGLNIECYSERRFILLGSQASGTLAENCPAVLDVVAKYFALDAIGAHDAPDAGPCAEWSGPEDDDALLDLMLRSRPGATAVFNDGVTFTDLWTPNIAALARRWPRSDRADGLPYDASSADASLASRLAWGTGRDADRIERLMRRSPLNREKYGRPDYLARTIAAACRSCSTVLQQRRTDAPPATPATVQPAAQLGTFIAASQGWIDAKIENVFDTLQSAESSARLAFDQFQQKIMISGPDGAGREFTDADYGRLRAEFGRRGFKPIAAEIMKTAVLMAADANKYDSALQWVESLRWDGVPRIDLSFPTYYRTADTPYTRAVGAYLFTAAAGRAASPGCQADMAVVLVGLQGARKTSAVSALCPSLEVFGEINLHKLQSKEDELARSIRGLLIGELAELRGLAGRDQESIKSWVSRRFERWRPVFREFGISYPRRVVLIGTTNEGEFLDDATGERRWLPVRAGAVDVEAIERDRDQLWAEGLQRFRTSGIAWQAAEELAKAEHAQFKVTDPWAEIISKWLAACPGNALGEAPSTVPRGAGALTVTQVASGALGVPVKDLDRKQELRIGKILRGLGYEKRQSWIEGNNVKTWALA